VDDLQTKEPPRPGEAREPNPRLARLRAIAERVATSHGLEIFDVQLRRESIGPVLRIVLDRPDPGPPPAGTTAEEASISVGDCQRISEDVGAILDVEDVIDRKYTLEVSSPGLDRPLRGPADYRRFAGRLARIVLAEPVDGLKHFKGRLRGIEGEAVLVEDERGVLHRVPPGVISRARLEVEF
jgi:ribosome maturation factor RimP